MKLNQFELLKQIGEALQMFGVLNPREIHEKLALRQIATTPEEIAQLLATATESQLRFHRVVPSDVPGHWRSP